jgi:hypothetical protein
MKAAVTAPSNESTGILGSGGFHGKQNQFNRNESDLIDG